jgi:hypothetical protein
VSVYGPCREVTDDAEKTRVLMAMIDGLCTGRANDTRPPNPAELAATLVVGVDIEEAALKRRSGPPIDDEEDYALDHWAGLALLAPAPVALEADPRLAEGKAVPEYLTRILAPPARVAGAD